MLSYEALEALARELRDELYREVASSGSVTAWAVIERFDAEFSEQAKKRDGVEA